MKTTDFCSIIIVLSDGRERVQVKSTPRWAALPYVKAFNSHTGDCGAYAELREPVSAMAAKGGAA
jgi:hypothetical protein